jgi:glycosyltransferase involved in cell wall biosynthesis
MYKDNQDLLNKLRLDNSSIQKGLTVKGLEDGSVSLINSSSKNQTINITRVFSFTTKNKVLKFVNNGVLKRGECYFNVGWTIIPLNATTESSLHCLKYCKITLTLKPNTEVILKELVYYILTKSELDDFASRADTLVISPGYPSSANLYSFGFVHTSSKGYVSAGLDVDVFCNHNEITNYCYKFDQLNIFRNNLVFLKNLINKSNYKRIIIHFLDEKLVDIIDSVVLYYGIKIYVYVHGAEVMHRNQEIMLTGYDGVFHKFITDEQVEARDRLFKKYAINPNIKWLFVSNWMKEEAEKMKVQFVNFSIVPNGLDTNIFKYYPKSSEQRLNIFTIRRFDNINKYAIDLVIDTILFLKDKDFFDKLNFYIYGDGTLFNKFQSQVAFANVKFTNGFFTQSQVSELHKNCGIIFHPTRVDSMGCSSLEGVCSGLVLVSSNTSAVPEFTSPSYGTLSDDIENPASYAAIIEDLYNNPDRFLELSKKMSEDISSKFSREIILAKELEFFNNEKQFHIEPVKDFVNNKILSICIPVYNIEKYLSRCMNSILSCNRKHLIELIVVNDGSTDNSVNIAHKFQEDFPTIITLINQENGGHGSAIMTGIKNATGKYFRIIDGDDWVDPIALDELLTKLEILEVDLVLTDVDHDSIEDYALSKFQIYEHLPKGQVLKLDEINFPLSFGPILSTSNYKTSILKNTYINLTKNCFYVDMEFNAYAIKNVNSVIYFDFAIYKYFIGRVSQSVSIQSFNARYKDHQKVIFNILDFIQQEDGLSNCKREYLTDNLVVAMIVPQLLKLTVILRRFHEAFLFYKKVRSKINSQYHVTNNCKIDSRIGRQIFKTIIKHLSKPILRFLSKVLLIPYNTARHIFQLLHVYDVYFFDRYARPIERVLMLPYKIALYVRRKF